MPLNTVKRRFYFLLLIGANLCACSPPPEKTTLHEQIIVFGTVVDITLGQVTQQQAHHVMQQIQQRLQYYHDAWHAWQPSQLTDLNRAIATGKSRTVAPELIELLQISQAISKQSGHLFNPAIGKLIRLWGFQRHDDAPWQPPSSAQLQPYLIAPPLMHELHIEQDQVSASNPNIQLDLGAIAKGYVIDKIIKMIQQQDINHAIVNAGGDLKTIGDNQGKPWKIGIQHPNKKAIIGVVETADGESIFTSGSYQRFFTYQGKTYHHLIDPRTAYPSENIVSATIIHPNASIADASATAFMLNGTQNWQALARSMKIQYVLLLDKDGHITMSNAMASRLKLKAA
ncbi:MAG: FAD:protein FMN transferase, partial [Methylococcales bacterium]|nr:FAD:protein FMN transferase [Methylococcales bacterium]